MRTEKGSNSHSSINVTKLLKMDKGGEIERKKQKEIPSLTD